MTLEKITKSKLTSNQVDSLSSPLLVSPKCITDSKNKILFIGQELNTWVNHKIDDNDITSTLLEDVYYNFLKNEIYRSPYWKFISEIIYPDSIVESVIWANILICGRKYEKGTPEITKDIQQISIDYLKKLYDVVKPQKVIITSSAREPYYSNILKFLELLHIQIEGYPTLEKPIIHDETNRLMWTYHPNYLVRSGNFSDVLEEAKRKVRK